MPQAGSVLERWRDLCTHSPKGREERASISMGCWLDWFDWSQEPVGAQSVKNLPAIQKTWVWSLGQEDPLEKGMETHSSILAWRIPWTEEPGGLQSMGSQRVSHDWVTSSFTFFQVSAKLVNVRWWQTRKIIWPSNRHWGVLEGVLFLFLFYEEAIQLNLYFNRINSWWNYQFNEYELGQTPGYSEGWGGLVYCSPWICKELDTTSWLNNK